MSIDIQKLSDTTFGVRLAQTLGRILPPKPGYRFAEFIGEQVASRSGSKMVKAIRANQWVVHGETLDRAELDKFVHETFRRSARFHFAAIEKRASEHSSALSACFLIGKAGRW